MKTASLTFHYGDVVLVHHDAGSMYEARIDVRFGGEVIYTHQSTVLVEEDALLNAVAFVGAALGDILTQFEQRRKHG